MMRPRTSILLVRHPETDANVNGRFVGRGESKFTATGLLQLRRVPAKIAAFRPDIVYTSPLSRSSRLAARAARLSGAPLVVDERIIELDFGAAEGMTFDEIVAAGLGFDYRNADRPVAPGGESRTDVERRVTSFFDDVSAPGGRIAACMHGGPFRASLAHLLGLAPLDVWAFHVHNAQLARVDVYDDGRGVLVEYVQG